MKKINKNLFKQSMSKFVTGVTVVTISENGNHIGKTVNSFTALSLNPPLVLFSLDNQSSSIKSYKKASKMVINVLSRKQKKLSEYFSLKNIKWENSQKFILENGTPIIKNCIANFSCKKVKIIKQGDHFIFICKIEKILIDNKKKPLIYFNSKYI